MFNPLESKSVNSKLSNNPYQQATFWLYKVWWFLDSEYKEKNKSHESSLVRLEYKDLVEFYREIEKDSEAVTIFLNKEMLNYHYNSVFNSTIKQDEHTVIIPKTQSVDQSFYEVNKPKELSIAETLAFCADCISKCDQMNKLEQAAIIAPESIAETWPAILPANANILEISEILMHTLPLNLRMAPYRIACDLKFDQDRKTFFFDEVLWDIFFLIGHYTKPAGRETYESLMQGFAPYLTYHDYELLMEAFIRDCYGDSVCETPWAFARVYMAEILLTDYKILLDLNQYERIIKLALVELDGYDDYIENDWAKFPDWCAMLDSLILLSNIDGVPRLLRIKIENYNAKRNNTTMPADFYIEVTRTTPRVVINHESLLIKGTSRPESGLLFYEPIIDHLERTLQNLPINSSFTINSFLVFFNTNSSSKLLALFRMAKKYSDRLKIRINWYAILDDEELHEAGEDFKAFLGDDFFYIVSVSQEDWKKI